jgi:outer membrane receptor protein involved in Fe transport
LDQSYASAVKWLCCVLVSLPVAAQAQEIVVTGRGLADPASDAAYAMATIDRDRLGGTASGRVEDALRDVAGFQQFRRSDGRSVNPTSQGATVRGLGGNAASRVLVLLDGVPQGDPFAGYLNWPSYLPERLGRVRFTRGGGSGVSGPGALAGTVEFESVEARDAATLGGSLIGGSFGAVEGRALVSAHLGSGFALVSGGYARGDGFVPVVHGGPADKRARYDQGSLAVRMVFPAFGGELQGSIDTFDDIRTRGTDFSRNATSGANASLRFVSGRMTTLGYVQMRKFASQFAAVDAARAIATPTLDQFNTPAIGLGGRIEWRPDLGQSEVRLGGDWRRTTGTTNELFSFVAGAPTRVRRAGGTGETLGMFGEMTHVFDALTLTGGGRIDHWSLRNGLRQERLLTGATLLDTRFGNRDGWQATGRVGMAFAATPALTLRGSAYLGWRLPTLNELYRPFRVGNDQTLANAALVPERSKGGEIGIDWRRGDHVRIGATAFFMRLDNAISNVTVSSGPSGTVRERRNITAILSKGVEFDAHAKWGNWSVSASGSVTEPRVQSTPLRPAQVAQVQTSVRLGWRGLSVVARYVGRQFDDDANTRRLGPALTVDMVAEWPLSDRVTVILRGENVFDALVPAALSGTNILERASPRTMWAGLRFGLASETIRR